MKVKFRYFSNIEEVTQKQLKLEEYYHPRRKRIRTVARFHNGLSKYDQHGNDADQEITNYLTSYRSLNFLRTSYQNMVNKTKRLVKVKLSTGDYMLDSRASKEISKSINTHIINKGTEFYLMYEKCGDEELFSGVSVAVFPATNEYLPDIDSDIMFPQGCKTQSSDVPYAFSKKTLTISDLVGYLEGDMDSEVIDRKAIKELLETMNKEIREGSSSTQQKRYDDYESYPFLHHGDKREACWYYEVQKDNSVSATLYLNGNFGADMKNQTVAIMHKKKAYSHVDDWIVFSPFSSIMRGDGTFEDTVGQAELIYNSSVETEEVLNAVFDRLMYILKTKLTTSPEMDEDEINSIDLTNDTFYDERISEMQVRNNTGDVSPMLQALERNINSVTNTGFANSSNSGVLSSQYKDLSSEKSVLVQASNDKRYRNLNNLLSQMVYKILSNKPSGDVNKMTTQQLRVLAVHSDLEREGIDVKPLIKRVGSCLSYMEVEAERVLSAGDPEGMALQLEFANNNMQRYAPSARNMLLYDLTANVLGPDKADTLMGNDGSLEKVIHLQSHIASTEALRIERSAVNGDEYPIRNIDIHQEHIPEHFIDLKYWVNRHGLKPWTIMDAQIVEGWIRHITAHIQEIFNQGFLHEAEIFESELQQYIPIISQFASEVADEGTNQQAQDLEAIKLSLKEREVLVKEQQSLTSREKEARLSDNFEKSMRLKEEQSRVKNLLAVNQQKLQLRNNNQNG